MMFQLLFGRFLGRLAANSSVDIAIDFLPSCCRLFLFSFDGFFNRLVAGCWGSRSVVSCRHRGARRGHLRISPHVDRGRRGCRFDHVGSHGQLAMVAWVPPKGAAMCSRTDCGAQSNHASTRITSTSNLTFVCVVLLFPCMALGQSTECLQDLFAMLALFPCLGFGLSCPVLSFSFLQFHPNRTSCAQCQQTCWSLQP